MFRTLALIVPLVLAAGMIQAHAGVITTAPTPDIEAHGIRIIYDANSGVFEARRGSATRYTTPSGDVVGLFPGLDSNFKPAQFGTFEMDAIIQPDGTFNSGDGNFTVYGALNETDQEVVLLKGTISEVNMTVFEKSGVIEFLAGELTGGLRDSYGGPNGSALLRMSLFHLDMTPTHNFEAYMFGSVDIGRPVPEPASMVIWGSVLAVGSILSRRRSRKLSVV